MMNALIYQTVVQMNQNETFADEFQRDLSNHLPKRDLPNHLDTPKDSPFYQLGSHFGNFQDLMNSMKGESTSSISNSKNNSSFSHQVLMNASRLDSSGYPFLAKLVLSRVLSGNHLFSMDTTQDCYSRNVR